MKKIIFIIFIFEIFFSCAYREHIKVEKFVITDDVIKEWDEMPITEFTPKQLDVYLKFKFDRIENIKERFLLYANKFIGQEYKLGLLGEFPFQCYDSDPLFSLKMSDCVVLAEHLYALSLADSWESFFSLLQRIRYEKGIVGFATRNHFIELDWVKNNNWLVSPMFKSNSLYIEKGLSIINKEKFLERHGVTNFITNSITTNILIYIPVKNFFKITNKIDTGSMIGFVKGKSNIRWISHVTIALRDNNGLSIIQSSMKAGEVIKDNANDFIAKVKENNINKKYPVLGFYMYKMNKEPLKELLKKDGENASLVSGRRGIIEKILKERGKRGKNDRSL